MPIRIPNKLPAVKTLEDENIFVMTETRAITQDIRPLKILLLNLMPTKIATETQISRLLGNSPLQVELEVNGTQYLLAHAMSTNPNMLCEDKVYLQGSALFQNFLVNGEEGYISICGHSNPEGTDIWRNSKGNVIICDCGCGFRSGRLGCLCLETGEEIYV